MTMKREHGNLKIHCDNAGSLVQGYLDGELTEAQAAPLREHLLDCPGCRELAKGGRTLRRWFQEAREVHQDADAGVPVPDGFASRVARRAFAGDPGLLIPEPRRASLMPFLLAATAVAAGLLLVLSIVIQRQTIPDSATMSADDYQPPWKDRPAEDRGAIDESAFPAYAVPPTSLRTPAEDGTDGEGSDEPEPDETPPDEPDHEKD